MAYALGHFAHWRRRGRRGLLNFWRELVACFLLLGTRPARGFSALCRKNLTLFTIFRPMPPAASAIPSETSEYWSQSLADELLRFLTSRMRCPETAADLTQEVYLGLKRSVENQAPDNARALAFRIAINLALDYQRRASVRNRHVVDAEWDSLAESIPGNTAGPEQILIGRERLARLQQALSELPVDCRTAFTLHSVEGLTYVEIAERLGVSRSQVNKLLSKAMAHCARRVDEA